MGTKLGSETERFIYTTRLPLFRGKKMIAPKEAYSYQNYIANIEGATLKVVSTTMPTAACRPDWNESFNLADSTAKSFMQRVKEADYRDGFEDFSNHKLELKEDKIELILKEIAPRDDLKYRNLISLYDDLLKISNWRLERPYPDKYIKDRIWSDLNKMEFLLREQIRKELKDFSHDTSFCQKDLRESLLEFKIQNQKSRMLDASDLEFEIQKDTIEPDGYNNQTGDLYRKQTMY